MPNDDSREELTIVDAIDEKTASNIEKIASNIENIASNVENITSNAQEFASNVEEVASNVGETILGISATNFFSLVHFFTFYIHSKDLKSGLVLILNGEKKVGLHMVLVLNRI